jgi:thiamine biosynthesis lipoprotein
MPLQRQTLINWILVFFLVASVAVAAWFRVVDSGETAVVRYPKRVMGTVCTLACVVERGDEAKAEAALLEVEKEIHRLEGLFSSWLTHSEVSELNAAKAGRSVSLSIETFAVLVSARTAFDETGGAFDVTCRPLVTLWRKAGDEGRLPTPEEIAQAREASSWKGFALGPKGIEKKRTSASVDLGGIAKGAVIDRAIELLRKGNFIGGLVDIGGDLRCFGTQPGGKPFEAEIPNPFGKNPFKVRLTNQAICTSGDYARYTEIEGARYSHIIDPRTGRALEESPSVTVVAPTAEQADIWATALSVLGPEGFRRLPKGVEALIIRPEGGLDKTAGFVLRETRDDAPTKEQRGAELR